MHANFARSRFFAARFGCLKLAFEWVAWAVILAAVLVTVFGFGFMFAMLRQLVLPAFVVCLLACILIVSAGVFPDPVLVVCIFINADTICECGSLYLSWCADVLWIGILAILITTQRRQLTGLAGDNINILFWPGALFIWIPSRALICILEMPQGTTESSPCSTPFLRY